MTRTPLTRRGALQLAAAAGLAACSPQRPRAEGAPDASAPPDRPRPDPAAPPPSAPASTPAPASTSDSTPASTTMNTRPIPRTGEQLPCIGLGTSGTFDVGADAADRAPLVEVMRRFLASGARVIDSSPMYGRAEEVTGDLLAELGAVGKPFLATKVWTTGKREGIEQMERSLRLMRAQRMDLMQVHNLIDVQTHLPVLREWKQAGKIRYLGVTHYTRASFPDLERLIRTESLDFVQLPYNLADREAEERLLPAARDTGTAVLVMRPFQDGDLFRLVKGKPLPPWAAEIDCASWAQLFLKFILAHPAVTCPIPATAKPAHLADNLQAGHGRLPDEATRRKMIQLLDG